MASPENTPITDETRLTDLTVADLKAIVREILADYLQAVPAPEIAPSPAEPAKKMSLDDFFNDLE